VRTPASLLSSDSSARPATEMSVTAIGRVPVLRSSRSRRALSSSGRRMRVVAARTHRPANGPAERGGAGIGERAQVGDGPAHQPGPGRVRGQMRAVSRAAAPQRTPRWDFRPIVIRSAARTGAYRRPTRAALAEGKPSRRRGRRQIDLAGQRLDHQLDTFSDPEHGQGMQSRRPRPALSAYGLTRSGAWWCPIVGTTACILPFRLGRTLPRIGGGPGILGRAHSVARVLSPLFGVGAGCILMPGGAQHSPCGAGRLPTIPTR
jgi:hypothetical protein